MMVKAPNVSHLKSKIPFKHDEVLRFDSTYKEVHNGETTEVKTIDAALRNDLRCITIISRTLSGGH